MTEPQEDRPRIIVDSDWKEQARREKEEADREARKQEATGGEVPGASFLEVVQMIVMQASVGLGGYQDPHSGQRIPPNLPIAAHYIDLLALVQEKTKGNLTEEEQKILDGTLQELRMAFVQMTSAHQEPESDQPEA